MIKKALHTAILPLMRICIRQGLRLQDIQDTIKKALIDAARAELLRAGEKPSLSRISVMTGLQRKDIKRLESTDQQDPGPVHFLTKVVGTWSANLKYLDQHQNPRPLDIGEFEELVGVISKDVNVYTALFELERVGIVQKKEDKLELLAQAFQPSKDAAANFELLGEDVHALISAVESNTFDSEKVPHLHVKTYYDNICIEYIPEIKDWILSFGERMHRELRGYLSKFDKDLNPTLHAKTGGAKITVGSFSHVAHVNSEEEN